MENYWLFRYRQGPATVESHVRAVSKEDAEATARAWCEKVPNRLFCAVLHEFSINGLIEVEPPKAAVKVKVG